MLINKLVKISTKGCRKIEYFESLGYDVSGDFFEIKIEDLNVGSTVIVDVECDYCKKILQTSYKEYLAPKTPIPQTDGKYGSLTSPLLTCTNCTVVSNPVLINCISTSLALLYFNILKSPEFELLHTLPTQSL